MITLLYYSEPSELQRLLDLISVCPSKQQLPSLEAEVEKSGSGRSRQRHHGSHHQSTEALSLEDFRFVPDDNIDVAYHSDFYQVEICSTSFGKPSRTNLLTLPSADPDKSLKSASTASV